MTIELKKAEMSATKLMVNQFGDTGTGKTIIALHFPKPAILDFEQGTNWYGDEFDFLKASPQTHEEVMQILKDICDCPKCGGKSKYGGTVETIIIDPISAYYDFLQREKRELALTEFKANRRGSPKLRYDDWGRIKDTYNQLIDFLTGSISGTKNTGDGSNRAHLRNVHIVVNGRMKRKEVDDIIYEVQDAEGMTEYRFDVVVKHSWKTRGKAKDEKKGREKNNRLTVILKDRTHTFETGQIVNDPSFKTLFKPMLDKLNKTESRHYRDNSATSSKPKDTNTYGINNSNGIVSPNKHGNVLEKIEKVETTYSKDNNNSIVESKGIDFMKLIIKDLKTEKEKRHLITSVYNDKDHQLHGKVIKLLNNRNIGDLDEKAMDGILMIIKMEIE